MLIISPSLRILCFIFLLILASARGHRTSSSDRGELIKQKHKLAKGRVLELELRLADNEEELGRYAPGLAPMDPCAEAVRVENGGAPANSNVV